LMIMLSSFALAVGAVALALAAPFAMSWMAKWQLDWSELSDVGQAYGGVSALLSALALCAIAGSLILQQRQTKTAQVVAVTERHHDLLRLALEHPEFIYVDSPTGVRADLPMVLYSNLTVSHWAMMWELGLLDEALLRKAASALFRHNTASVWWASIGPDWTRGRATPGGTKFVRILMDEYKRLIDEPPIPLRDPDQGSPIETDRLHSQKTWRSTVNAPTKQYRRP